jgi:hypothetical protein
VSRASWSGGDLDAWLTPYVGVMGRSTLSKWAPLYVRGLLSSDGPKSVQPIATRLGLPGHDQLHHFVSCAAWDDARSGGCWLRSRTACWAALMPCWWSTTRLAKLTLHVYSNASESNRAVGFSAASGLTFPSLPLTPTSQPAVDSRLNRSSARQSGRRFYSRRTGLSGARIR